MSDETTLTRTSGVTVTKTRGCFTDAEIGTWRQGSTMPEEAEERLFRHLAVPCETCLQRLLVLTFLQPDVVLPTTMSAVILALRTIGQYPPRPLLWPRHREALDAVGEPMGFPWLVVEEARLLEGPESVEQLERWRRVLNDPLYSTIDSHGAESLGIRLGIYLSDAYRRCGAADQAEIECGRVTFRLATYGDIEAPEVAQYLALQARLGKSTKPAAGTHRLYQNAVDKLDVPEGSRRIIGLQLEILLEYGQCLAEAKDSTRAWQTLRRAEELPQRDEYPALEVVLWLELATLAYECSTTGKLISERFWIAWAVGYLEWLHRRERHLSDAMRARKDRLAERIDDRFDELTTRTPEASAKPLVGRGSIGLVVEKFGSQPRIEALLRPVEALREDLVEAKPTAD